LRALTALLRFRWKRPKPNHASSIDSNSRL
jgi:hypothetical protein